MIKRVIFIIFCTWTMSINAQPVAELSWEDLIPEFEKKLLEIHERQTGNADDYSPVLPRGFGKVRKALDGEHIKIAGFVIPLEGDEDKVYEMLLVPYMGACFHVPPPPANQIIYVKFKDGVAIKNLWDVVYVTGVLRTEAISHEFAEVGYVLEGESTQEYEQE
jgi:hypothetical protein